MATRHRKAILVTLIVCLSGLACGTEEVPLDDVVLLPQGKLDDYRSTIGQEFDVTGVMSVRLTGSDTELVGEARIERARELAATAVDKLTKAFNDKLEKIFDKATRKSTVSVMVRFCTSTFDGLVAGEGTSYHMIYSAEVAGPGDMLSYLPLEAEGDRKVLKVGLSDQTVSLTFEPVDNTGDAYPQYLDMFQDGLDIAIHVGGDYNDPRSDLDKAKAIYNELVALKLKSPVERFDDLALESGDFVGELDVAGRKVAVRARLYHADMAPDDQLDKLVDAYKQSAASADIVVYTGHAGISMDYSGVVVHYNPRVALKGDDFATIELPDKYQVFVFSGCETYSGYADSLYKNPKKTSANLDVVTTVNFSSSRAPTMPALVRTMLDQTLGTWRPNTWDEVLRALNDAHKVWDAIYGVHGLSDNPKISPLADPTTIGKDCLIHDDCPGIDNLCIRGSYFSVGRVCGAACVDDSGCPAGSKCKWVYSSYFSRAIRQCFSQ
ncbi:MAG: hypothetical protein KAI47_28325 [Deltaproteobacteria bacterium]|nr:hypothetical protein [Deltaproteobacteria bacterium]